MHLCVQGMETNKGWGRGREKENGGSERDGESKRDKERQIDIVCETGTAAMRVSLLCFCIGMYLTPSVSVESIELNNIILLPLFLGLATARGRSGGRMASVAQGRHRGSLQRSDSTNHEPPSSRIPPPRPSAPPCRTVVSKRGLSKARQGTVKRQQQQADLALFAELRPQHSPSASSFCLVINVFVDVFVHVFIGFFDATRVVIHQRHQWAGFLNCDVSSGSSASGMLMERERVPKRDKEETCCQLKKRRASRR